MTLLDVSDDQVDDEFFLRGEELAHVADSLEPPMGFDVQGEGVERVNRVTEVWLRTPEQLARRERYIRFVSLTMGGLVIGLVGLYAKEFWVGAAQLRLLPGTQTSAVVLVEEKWGSLGGLSVTSSVLKKTEIAPQMALAPIAIETAKTPVIAAKAPQKHAFIGVRASRVSSKPTPVVAQEKPANYQPPTASFAD
jgi:hypothetical protein